MVTKRAIDINVKLTILFLDVIRYPMPKKFTTNCVKNLITEYEGMKYDPIFGSN